MAQKTYVSAGAIILCNIAGEIKIALAQRQRNTDPWVLPKGNIEKGETYEEAALREVREEAGLQNIQLISYLGTVTRKSGKNDLKEIHYYLAYALDDVTLPSQPSDPNFSEVGWFLPQQVLEVLAHKEERDFIKQLLGPLLHLPVSADGESEEPEHHRLGDFMKRMADLMKMS